MKSIHFFTALVLSIMLLSESIYAQELEGEWQVKSSAVIRLLDTTILFRRDSSDNIIDLSNVTYHFNPDGSYEGNDIWGNPISGTWTLSQFGNTLSIDDKSSSLDEINDNEFLIYFPFQPFNNYGFVDNAGSYISFVRSSPSRVSSAAASTDISLSISPNPFVNITQLKLTTPTPLVSTSLEVFNAQGKQILSEKGDSYLAGSYQIPLDLSGQPGGMYFLALNAGNRVLLVKMCKY
ncbi:T9SS type A sorting domain-containing protein [Phaeodactylibacter xiamenensis]|uniref:T9SS type A sorting domain-containing protein n=1 Tax=Phaeodactylibacter xiamenensis TaxID=1524460 RepID=UPI003CCC08BA